MGVIKIPLHGILRKWIWVELRLFGGGGNCFVGFALRVFAARTREGELSGDGFSRDGRHRPRACRKSGTHAAGLIHAAPYPKKRISNVELQKGRITATVVFPFIIRHSAFDILRFACFFVLAPVRLASGPVMD